MQIITSKIHFTFVTGNVLFQHGIWLISVTEVKSAIICVGWKTPQLSNVLTLYRWLEIILFNEEWKFYFPQPCSYQKKKGIKPLNLQLKWIYFSRGLHIIVWNLPLLYFLNYLFSNISIWFWYADFLLITVFFLVVFEVVKILLKACILLLWH